MQILKQASISWLTGVVFWIRVQLKIDFETSSDLHKESLSVT